MIELATTICLGVLGLAAILVLVRILLGPTLADRILGLDALTLLAIAAIAVFALRTGEYGLADIAISLGLVSFVATVAFARYLLSRPS